MTSVVNWVYLYFIQDCMYMAEIDNKHVEDRYIKNENIPKLLTVKSNYGQGKPNSTVLKLDFS